MYLLGCVQTQLMCKVWRARIWSFNVFGTKEKWTSSPLSVPCMPHKITLCFQAHGIGSLLMHTVTGKWIKQFTFPAVISLLLYPCWKKCKNKGVTWHFSQCKGLWMTEMCKFRWNPTYYLLLTCIAVVRHGQWDLTLKTLCSSVERIPWMLFGCNVLRRRGPCLLPFHTVSPDLVSCWLGKEVCAGKHASPGSDCVLVVVSAALKIKERALLWGNTHSHIHTRT